MREEIPASIRCADCEINGVYVQTVTTAIDGKSCFVDLRCAFCGAAFRVYSVSAALAADALRSDRVEEGLHAELHAGMAQKEEGEGD